jgi:hypothetical protein
VLVFNKVDRLTHEEEEAWRQRARRTSRRSVFVSTVEEGGVEPLRELLRERVAAMNPGGADHLPGRQGGLLAEIYREGEVLEREDEGGSIHLRVRLPTAALGRLGWDWRSAAAPLDPPCRGPRLRGVVGGAARHPLFADRGRHAYFGPEAIARPNARPRADRRRRTRRSAGGRRDTSRGWAPGGVPVLHTSGALGAEVLEPLAELGHIPRLAPPAGRVPTPSPGADRLLGAWFGVEGDGGGSLLAERIVERLDGAGPARRAGAKALYHAAAVFASNYVVALLLAWRSG